MAINPDDFIFHSDLVYEQELGGITYGLSVTGNINAGSERSWASPWYSLPVPNSTVRAEVTIPGTLYDPNTTNGRFPTPVINTYNNTDFLQAIARVEQQANRYRFVVSSFNPYGVAKSSPGRTYTFKSSFYIPPSL